MLEKAMYGSKGYWKLIFVLLCMIAVGFAAYMLQLRDGLAITGMSRDVSWGFYIAQFTFLVGVAASAVMVVLPYYVHNFKAFGKMTILGEFLAISAVVMCMLFIFVDLGKPFRLFNTIIFPHPKSMVFWDIVSLGGYLALNAVIGLVCLDCERNHTAPPKWLKPLVYLSIPWAVSIHTVTAFLYSGMGGRSFWFTAIMAPRFLASAFSAGPAILILLSLFVRKISKFDPGKEAIQKLGVIVTYAVCINIFFLLLEVFTVFYSSMPEHMHHFEYLFAGLHGKGNLVNWMYLCAFLYVLSMGLLLFPSNRKKEGMLLFACLTVLGSTWIDKGMALIVAGFIPNPFNQVTEYTPTVPELLISVGVYGIGGLILAVLYKVVLTIRNKEAS